MASNSFGEFLRLTSFGESHGPALGAVIDGCPAGVALAVEDFLPELARRRPGQSAATSARRESDRPEILSGVFEGRTTGMPIAVIVRNEDARPEDYEELRARFRPGHADRAYAEKYGHRDHRGGGRSSGRETVARVIAGVIARKLLPPGCRIIAHAVAIGGVRAAGFDASAIEKNAVRSADAAAAVEMEARILEAKSAFDSLGGVVGLRIEKPPAGLGDPVFGKLEAKLGEAMLSIGAVVGFAIGSGSAAGSLRGSEWSSDPARSGGISGGISTGETIFCEIAVKPASSIGEVARKGRHDPCIVPRVIPVVEAMAALVLADRLLLDRALRRPGGDTMAAP